MYNKGFSHQTSSELKQHHNLHKEQEQQNSSAVNKPENIINIANSSENSTKENNNNNNILIFNKQTKTKIIIDNYEDLMMDGESEKIDDNQLNFSSYDLNDESKCTETKNLLTPDKYLTPFSGGLNDASGLDTTNESIVGKSESKVDINAETVVDSKLPSSKKHTSRSRKGNSFLFNRKNKLNRRRNGTELEKPGEQNSETSSVTESIFPVAENLRKFGQKFIILHYSPFKAVWDWIVLLLVLYTAIATPYTAAFLLNEDEKRAKLNQNAATRLLNSERTGAHPLIILDLIVDIMFLVDILLSFRTTFVSKEGEVISDPMDIAKSYLKGWFLIDSIAAMPYDLLIFGSGNIDTLKITGLLKIIRLLRLARIFKKLEQYSEYGSAVLLSLMAVFAIAGHWLACVFYAIAYMERPTLPYPQYTWLDHLAEKYNMPYYENDSNSGPDLNSKYITALFFTLTSLTSVGFGNVAPTTNGEKCFSIIAMLLGSLLSAAIFGNVTTIMMKMYQGTEELKEMRTSVTDFIKFHQIPKLLSKRMEDSFEHTWTYTNGIDMNTILKSFPESLQADICLHLNRQLLNTCPAFRDANRGCLRMLALQFKSTHVPPGDTLIHKGDNLTAIYFIARGTLEIVKNDTVMAILDKNDIFGENLSKYEEEDVMGRSTCDVRALSYCDLHKIERRDLLDILDQYPDFAQSFKENFQVTFDLRECELTDNTGPNRKRHHSYSIKHNESFNKPNTDTKNLIQFAKMSSLVISTAIDRSYVSPVSPAQCSASNNNVNEPEFLDSSISRFARNRMSRSAQNSIYSKLNLFKSNNKCPSLHRKMSNRQISSIADIETDVEILSNRILKIEDTLRTQLETLTNFVLSLSTTDSQSRSTSVVQ